MDRDKNRDCANSCIIRGSIHSLHANIGGGTLSLQPSHSKLQVSHLLQSIILPSHVTHAQSFHSVVK